MSASSSADIINVLDSLVEGELPTEATIAVLSDLDRDDAAEVASRWPSILPELRLGIIALAVDLAVRRIELNFQRLAYVALGDTVPGVREAALYALDDIGGRETVSRVADLLEHETNAGVIAAGASASAPYILQYELGQLDESVGEQLLSALRSHAENEALPSSARAALVEAVAYVQELWVEEVIRTATYSEDQAPRLSAIVAMGRSANPEWLEYLDEQLQAEDQEVRERAAQACGEIADEAAVPMLIPLLDDESTEVIAAVLLALAEIGGEDALAALQDYGNRVPEELEATLDEATEAASGQIQSMSAGLEVED